jgi:uncharacterized coiled-coil DUF342 family protein
MVFGLQKLHDQIFCLTEERDFFQGKYLEQVSEIVNLKEQLLQSRKEISRLRKELMGGSNATVACESSPKQDQDRDEDDQSTTASCSSASSLTQATNDADDKVDEDENIRQSAEKLLQWASYRSSAYCAKSPETQKMIADIDSTHKLPLLER